MKYSAFEKNIREKINGHTMPVDTDALWQKVNLQEKSSRLKPLLFWVFITACIALIIGFIIGQSADDRHDIIEQAVNTSSLPSDNHNLSHQTNTSSPSVNPMIVESKSTQGVTKGKEINIAKNINVQKSIQTDINNGHNTTMHDTKAPLFMPNDESSFLSEATNFTAIRNNALTNSNITYDSHNSTLILNLNPIQSRLNNKLNLPLSSTLLANSKIECPEFGRKNSGIGLEIIADFGIFKPFKSLKALSTDPTETEQLRINQEESKEGFHGDLMLRLSHPTIPFYAQLGIAADHFTERMDLNYTQIKNDTMIGIVSITKSETGDTITVIYGDIVTTTETKGRRRRHYTVSTIDLPIMIGYQKRWKRWNLGIEGGTAVNITTISKGNILSSVSDFTQVEKTKPFKQNIGLSWIGNIRLGYEFLPRHTIYASTGIRYIPQSISNITSSLSQKYIFGGLHIGYGYRL